MLIVDEEEGAVLDDRSADRETTIIADVRVLRIRTGVCLEWEPS